MLAGFVFLSDGTYLNLAMLPFVQRGGIDHVKVMHHDGSTKIYGGDDARAILATLDPENNGTPEDMEYADFLGRGGTLTRGDWKAKRGHLSSAFETMASAEHSSDRWRRASEWAADLERELLL